VSHLQHGKDYLASGSLDKASVEFRNAAQIEPRNAEALYYNGRVAERRGSFKDAMRFYLGAIDANSSYDAARASLGRLFVFASAAQRALDTIQPGLDRHPNDPDLLAVRAAAHQQLKDHAGALKDAEAAYKLAPTNENAVAILASLYSVAGQKDRAISVVSDAVQHVPASVDLRSVLANLYLTTGQPEKAEEQMRRIIELQPTDLAPRTQLAVHLLRAHKVDAAQLVLERAVQDFSKGKDAAKTDSAKLALVEFVSTQRSRQEGEKTLRDFIAREPDNLDLRLGLGALLQRAGALQEALVAYQDVVKHDGVGPKGLLARDRMAAIDLGEGHPELARKLIAEVLERNPRDDDALMLRSSVEMKQGDATGAIADLRAVLRDQPTSVPLQHSLAQAYLATGQPALAEETLRAAIQTTPNDASVRIELAQLLARTERAPQAITLLEEGVKLLPDNLSVREALLLAYLSGGNIPGARGVAEELKKRQPQSAAGFYYTGLVAAREKQWEESQSNLESALKIEPRNLDALSALVRVDVARGAYDVAIGHVQAVLALEPKNINLVSMLGALYMERKDFKRAGEQFAHASELDPHLWQPHRNLAAVKFAENDPEGALEEYRAALRLAPADPELVSDAATVYEKHGRVDEALAAYEGLYRNNSKAQQFAANNLAMLLVTYKKDQASLDRARDLTNTFTASDNGALLDTVGWVRFKRGEYQDALPTLERALQQAPNSKVIRFHLAMAQLQLGLKDRARANLESVLTGADSFQGADEARIVLASLKGHA
jgi:tetratricopeptide (TPR) repeat protein